MRKSKPQLDEILSYIAGISGISEQDMKSRKRHEKIVDARQAFCCCCFYSGYVYEVIANFINRSHSTIVTLCNDRHLTFNAASYITQFMESMPYERKLYAMSYRLCKDPRDEYAKQKLKQLL